MFFRKKIQTVQDIRDQDDSGSDDFNVGYGSYGDSDCRGYAGLSDSVGYAPSS